MADSVAHLMWVLTKNRAPTQKEVIKSLLRGNRTAKKIAADTELSYNSVSIALHQLTKRNAIQRVKHGVYNVEEPLIALALMNKVSILEERVREEEAEQTVTT